MVYLFNKEGTKECTHSNQASCISQHGFTKLHSARAEAEVVLSESPGSYIVHLDTWLFAGY